MRLLKGLCSFILTLSAATALAVGDNSIHFKSADGLLINADRYTL